MKKTKLFKDLSRRDGLNLKRPSKARVNLALLAGTVFSLAAVPSFASSPAVGSLTTDATSSQVAPETFLIKGSQRQQRRGPYRSKRNHPEFFERYHHRLQRRVLPQGIQRRRTGNFLRRLQTRHTDRIS